MQLKAQSPEPVGDSNLKVAGLILGVAVDNDVVRLCRVPDYAEDCSDVLSLAC